MSIPVFLNIFNRSLRRSTEKRDRPGSRGFSAAAVLIFGTIFGTAYPASASAADIDTVYFRNGDRLIGEVKGLNKALLNFKTDAAGTINIEWADISGVVTRTRFQIKTRSGRYYFGRLDRGITSGRLSVVDDSSRKEIEPDNIVEVYPIKETFWKRLEGRVYLGLSYTKANRIGQLNFGGLVNYYRYLDRTRLTVNSIITKTSGTQTSEKIDAELLQILDLSDSWFTAGNAVFSKNTELGLLSRYSISAGLGRFLIQSQSEHFFVWAGLSMSYERSENAGGGFGLEAPVNMEFSVFKYDHPKLNLLLLPHYYQGITTLQRFRTDIDLQFTWEIAYDFFWKLTLYHNYDHRPPDGSGPRSDFGTTLGLEYKI